MISVNKWIILILYFQNQLIRTASTPVATDDDESNVVVRNKRETDVVQLRKDDALNQFISELSSNIHGRRYSEVPSQSNVTERKEQQNVSVDSEKSSNVTDKVENNNDNIISDSTAVGENERQKSSDLLAQPSHFVTVIEVKENKTPEATATTTVTSSSSSFKSIRSGYENVIIENNKRNSNLISEMDRSSNTTSFSSSNIRPLAPPISHIQDAKKKIPPR